MQIFRIGDSRHALWDGTGAAMVGGRWNSPGRPAIYGSLSYACSMLEILVHANIGRIPKTHCYVVADVPADVPVERHDSMSLPPGWDGDDPSIARRFGDQWLTECRSAVLAVPSVVAKLEWNAVVNPKHPAANQISVLQSQIVVWDQRLFGHTKPPLSHVPGSTSMPVRPWSGWGEKSGPMEAWNNRTPTNSA